MSGEVTKSGAKNAKSDAQKYYKRKNDPEGMSKIEAGDEAFKAGDFAKAKQLFDEATEICKNSSVEKTQKVKAEAKVNAEEGVQDKAVVDSLSSAKLLLVRAPMPSIVCACIPARAVPCRHFLDAKHSRWLSIHSQTLLVYHVCETSFAVKRQESCRSV